MLAHERSGPPADARGPPAVVAEAGSEVKLRRAPFVRDAVSRRTSTVAGQEASFDLGDETVGQLELAAVHASRSSSGSPCRAGRRGAGPRRVSAGPTENQPASSPPTSRPNSGGSSKRGTHHQSIEPSGATSAAERVSPMSP